MEAHKISKRVSTTTSPMFRSSTPVLADTLKSAKPSEQLEVKSVIHVIPQQNNHTGNLNEVINNADAQIKNTNESSATNAHAHTSCSAIIEEEKDPTKTDAQSDCIDNIYVYTDHKVDNSIDNRKDVCVNHEINRNTKPNVYSQNESELNDNDDQSKSCVKAHNVTDKHVTFKKSSLDESLSNSLNEEDEYIITDIQVSDIQTTCDIHDSNLISPRRNISEGKTRKTNSPRTKVYSGSIQQGRSRKLSETNSGSKRRRPSFQESLV